MKIKSDQVQSSDKLIFIVVFIMAVGFAIAASINFYKSAKITKAATQGIILYASTDDVIGPQSRLYGDPKSPYTLVEFADYQCPPCRAANVKLHQILKNNNGKVRFAFRNFPLVRIHPLAMPAAIAAEKSRTTAEFWAIHDLLYSGDALDSNRISAAQHILAGDGEQLQNNTDQVAMQVVKNDMNEAEVLGIHGTPTFILCCPGNTIRRIASLDQMEQFVRQASLH